ncbi:mitochondrial 54S ribosomal protein mL67 [Magnusiomyces paraingens]|uniref:Large ribosomal subunit protein mL67 n=1 Tax=Magnusiomyces paraingens TaxID=2606893 RepID=A0A5E8B6G6_9ASCO|nr:uncharacterized protein SAPINGB_P001536 [Saprochaete ingens]VVT47087.1 unnamed protein product [Saprochaete ingens]
MSGVNHRALKIFGNHFGGRFRHPAFLRRHGFGPDVFLFRNLESGQVMYTQLPFPQAYNIKTQFQNPNWQNRLPDIRRDIWRPMAMAQLPSYPLAVELYESLVTLRHYRDKLFKKEANGWRKRNDDGNIWYSGQYRPTYSQEAVADLASVLNAFDVETKVLWDGVWRKGQDEFWKTSITHEELPAFNPRDSYSALRQLGYDHYLEFQQTEKEAYEAKKAAAGTGAEKPAEAASTAAAPAN